MFHFAHRPIGASTSVPAAWVALESGSTTTIRRDGSRGGDRPPVPRIDSAGGARGLGSHRETLDLVSATRYGCREVQGDPEDHHVPGAVIGCA